MSLSDAIGAVADRVDAMAQSAPGEVGSGTTVSYAGPQDLRLDLPERDPERARTVARELLSRAASAAADAEAAVGRTGTYRALGPALLRLRSANQAALTAAQGSDPFAALAEVRRRAADVDEVAAAIRAAAATSRGGRA